MIEMDEQSGWAHYNARQSTLERRFSGRLTFVANYLRSKVTDDQSSDSNCLWPLRIHSIHHSTMSAGMRMSTMFSSSSAESNNCRVCVPNPGCESLPIAEPYRNPDVGQGQPFAAVSGQDNSRSGVNLDRADSVPRARQELPSRRPRAGSEAVLLTPRRSGRTPWVLSETRRVTHCATRIASTLMLDCTARLR